MLFANGVNETEPITGQNSRFFKIFFFSLLLFFYVIFLFIATRATYPRNQKSSKLISKKEMLFQIFNGKKKVKKGNNLKNRSQSTNAKKSYLIRVMTFHGRWKINKAQNS